MARYLVLGTNMGEAVAHALLRADPTTTVTIADIDARRLDAAAKRLSHPKLRTATVDATSLPAVRRLMRTHDAVIAAVSYELNAILTDAAIDEGVHFVDLGGNNDVVAAQFAMGDEARDAGIAVIPDNGIAPGAVSILTMHALGLLGGGADLVMIRVGGLPQRPRGVLGYAKAFSVRGLINEYVEPVLVLRDGREIVVPPMGDIETLSFDGIGDLEAAYTSGGSSTLTKSLAGRVRSLDYKTLRYPGHWDRIRTLMDLGFFDPRAREFGNRTIAPREMAECLLDEALPEDRHDLMAVRVTALKGADLVRLEMVDRYDPATGLTAMQRTTGFSAAIVARMIAEGDIAARGTLRLEDCVPPALFIERWKELGLTLTEARERFAAS